MKTKLRTLVVAAAVAVMGSAMWLTSSVAQEAASGQAPAATEARVGDDEAGRLPPGYTVIVTKAQREKIYQIQEQFQSQLEDLRKQIAAIESKRDQEIAGLLDAEQKTILAYVLKVRERDRQKVSPEASGGN